MLSFANKMVQNRVRPNVATGRVISHCYDMFIFDATISLIDIVLEVLRHLSANDITPPPNEEYLSFATEMSTLPIETRSHIFSISKSMFYFEMIL